VATVLYPCRAGCGSLRLSAAQVLSNGRVMIVREQHATLYNFATLCSVDQQLFPLYGAYLRQNLHIFRTWVPARYGGGWRLISDRLAHLMPASHAPLGATLPRPTAVSGSTLQHLAENGLAAMTINLTPYCTCSTVRSVRKTFILCLHTNESTGEPQNKTRPSASNFLLLRFFGSGALAPSSAGVRAFFALL
jgi:hypothetical protein